MAGNSRSSLRVETDLVDLNTFGTDVMVLNSSEVIADLLDKRPAIYPDKSGIANHVYSVRG